MGANMMKITGLSSSLKWAVDGKTTWNGLKELKGKRTLEQFIQHKRLLLDTHIGCEIRELKGCGLELIKLLEWGTKVVGLGGQNKLDQLCNQRS